MERDLEHTKPGRTDVGEGRGVRFLHPVGASTLRQGLTVPVSAQHTSWLKSIQKGQKLRVTISFGDGESVSAWLRRINNARGHLQFRYESGEQARLRQFLTEEFGGRPPDRHELIEVVETAPCNFFFRTMPGDHRHPARLDMHRPVLHNLSHLEAECISEIRDLRTALADIEYRPDHGQREYNADIANTLTADGWRREARVVAGLGLKVDFERNGVWLEVEFGNARTYYQDYVKFMLALRFSSARCGILLCPTEPFAHLLCELGQQRARAKRRGEGIGRPTYSGMMTYEKAVREFPYLGSIFNGKIVVAGIHVARDVPSPGTAAI